MNVTTTTRSFGERELSALNARVDALSMRDASVGRGCRLGRDRRRRRCPLEWRISSAPEFD